jgi:hypothetical protein
MHFERVKVGDHYSVSPEATLGPTQGAKEEREQSEQRERLREKSVSRENESRVREASD